MRIHVDKMTEDQLAEAVAKRMDPQGRGHGRQLSPMELFKMGKYKPYMYDSQAAELIRAFKVWITPLLGPKGAVRAWEAGLAGQTQGYFSYDPNKPWRAICKAVIAGKDGFVDF